MKKRFSRPLPRIWKPLHRGIVFESDLKVAKNGKLRAKLLVFDTLKSMRTFWGKHIRDGAWSGALAVVSALASERFLFKDGKEQDTHLQVDPRYFCVIGIPKGIQSRHQKSACEIICHESVHAALCYEKRRKGHIFANANDLDEENIAYPAGRIARQINVVMIDNDFY